MVPHEPMNPETWPATLVVDLDGTLLRIDTLWELWLRWVLQSPWAALRALGHIAHSRAAFKAAVARGARLHEWQPQPLNPEFTAWLRACGSHYRRVVLATGADFRVARRAAEQLGLFCEVIASDGKTNLTGRRKAEALRERFPEGFAYAGNSAADLTVWQAAAQSVFVNTPGAVQRRAKQTNNIGIFDPPARRRAFAETCRPHQWSKNLLIFLVAIASHQLAHLWHLPLWAAFASFCCVASAVYCINDVVDLEADRSHPTKKHRPVARGDLGVAAALVGALALLVAGFALAAWAVGPQFTKILLVYFVLTSLYSFRLKELPMVDVLALSLLYCIRVVAGGAAIGVTVSFWLLACCLFLFLSLASAKRASEFICAARSGFTVSRRGYSTDDTAFLQSLGVASGLVSALVVGLYIEQPTVVNLYHQPQILWAVVVLLTYWVIRIWMLTSRGQMNLDPIAFAVRDRTTYVVGGLVAAVLIVATLGGG